MANVLIMENEPGIVMVLEMALSEAGHQVSSVADGQAGIDLLLGGEIPDVVLLDLNMPGLDERGVLAKMQQSPELCQIPVVLMTGDMLDDDALPPRQQYAAILRKPFDIWELVRQVELLCD